jgi:hypothetical protein
VKRPCLGSGGSPDRARLVLPALPEAARVPEARLDRKAGEVPGSDARQDGRQVRDLWGTDVQAHHGIPLGEGVRDEDGGEPFAGSITSLHTD